jgi:hypothetical protein
MKGLYVLLLFSWFLVLFDTRTASLTTGGNKESSLAAELTPVPEIHNSLGSKPIPIVDNPATAIEKNNSKGESAYWPPIWSNWALVLVGIGAGVIGLRTLTTIHRQADIANTALLLSHRPRIKAQTFVLTNQMFDEHRVAIRYEIANFGGMDATIADTNCTILLRHLNDAPDLPMLPPYEVGPAHHIVEPGNVLCAGETRGFYMTQDVPDDKDIEFLGAQMAVYVIGYLSYKGSVGPHYRTAFCRRLQLDRFTPMRFAVVPDANYEYET